MPGRVMMDSQGAGGSQDLKKDRSHAQGHVAPQIQSEIHVTTPPVPVNNGPLADAAPADYDGRQPPMKIVASTAIPPSSAGHPPELDQTWRNTDANKSMGLLIERLAQQCISDLGDVVNKMSEAPTEPAPSQPNGVTTSHTTDTSETSLGKKRTFMEFAKDQRDRFTKTLVLSDWCRNGEDMAKLVDLKVYQEKWTAAQNAAIWSIGQTKHDLSRNGSKLPNPNLEEALELLSTGRSHFPDMGYLPPKRLSAKQLLSTLQDMNVLLATRLNLHEDLPLHFNSYTIANGRATFRVPGEFEVDLSIADEDETSQFYFIDVRFTFSPASHRVPDEMYGQLEARTNAALAAKGLRGCYEFLHNFVLTYKINTLGDQARELSRGKWFDSLRLEQKRRILVIQYWSALPGARKSWIEIGINTGKHPVAHRTSPSKLSARWMRKTGAEIEATPLEIDDQKLDVEQILHATIAKHISWRLTRIRDALLSIGGKSTKLSMELKTSPDIPEDCSLTLSLPNTESPFTVRIEPTLGRISISPATTAAARMEHRLNSDADQDVPRGLAYLLCNSIQDRVSRTAELAGWRPCALLRQPNIHDLLGSHTLARNFYVCNRSWGDNWALVVTFSLLGEEWLVARLESKTHERSKAPGHIISAVQKFPTDAGVGASPALSRTLMLRIERLAAIEISFTALSQKLSSMKIPCRIERVQALGSDRRAMITSPSFATTMAIDSSALLKALDNRKRTLAVVGPVRISHLEVGDGPVGDGEPETTQEMRLTLRPGKLPYLQEHLKVNGRDAVIAMNRSGALAIRLRSPFGQPFVAQIQSRLRLCERLDHLLGVLQSQKVKCTSASLSKIAFTYRDNPELGASISYPDGDQMPTTIQFLPIDANPHRRIQAQAEKLLNGGNKVRDSFMVLVKSLTTSLSLFESFDKLTAAHRDQMTLNIEPLQITHYSLCYRPPLPTVIIDITLRARDLDGSRSLVWSVTLSSPKLHSPAIPDGLKKALIDLFSQKGEGWYGISNGGMVAQPEGISTALTKLDEIMRRFEGTSTDPPKAEGVSAAPPTAVKQQDGTGAASTTGAQPTPSVPPTQKAGSAPGPPRQQRPPAAQMQRTASQQRNGVTAPGPAPPPRAAAGKNKHEVIELD